MNQKKERYNQVYYESIQIGNKLKHNGKSSSKEICLKMVDSNKIINAQELMLKRMPKDQMLITTHNNY